MPCTTLLFSTATISPVLGIHVTVLLLLLLFLAASPFASG
jgi:hypothetical protein